MLCYKDIEYEKNLKAFVYCHKTHFVVLDMLLFLGQLLWANLSMSPSS